MSNNSELSGLHILADLIPKTVLRKECWVGTSEGGGKVFWVFLVFAPSDIKLVGSTWFAYWSQEAVDQLRDACSLDALLGSGLYI